MAKDVDGMLQRIIAAEGGMGKDAAVEYVEKLRDQRRYQRDIY